MVPMKWTYVPEGFEEKAGIELRRSRSFVWTHQIVGGVGQNYSESPRKSYVLLKCLEIGSSKICREIKHVFVCNCVVGSQVDSEYRQCR